MLESVLFPVGGLFLGAALAGVVSLSVFLFGSAICGGVAGCLCLLRDLPGWLRPRRV